MRSVRWSADLRSWSCTAAGGGLAAASQSRCGSGGYQSSHSDKVVGGGDQVAGQSSPLQAAVARASEATHRFHPPEDFFNGLFTNDKFCWSRPARLHLKWWHRAYRVERRLGRPTIVN